MTPATAVRCTELRLRNFRNFADARLELPPAGAAITGDNGAGKTNLVEALYYLEIFRSFRGAADEQLVRFGEDAFFVHGRFEAADGRTTELTAAYEPRTRTKRVTSDGVEPDRLSDALGRIGTVIFSPSDVRIVGGGPGERRRFLDIVLSLNVPGYVTALQRYRHVLRQRNAMLRAEVAGAVLEAFDEGMIQAGARLVAERARWVAAHAPRFAQLFREISAGLAASIRYHSDVPLPALAEPEAAGAAEGRAAAARAAAVNAEGNSAAVGVVAGGAEGNAAVVGAAAGGAGGSAAAVGGVAGGVEGSAASEAVEAAAAAFRERLARVAPRERERGVSLAGPHRDDLALELDTLEHGVDLRQYGSGGQLRTAAIALRMIEADTIQAARGCRPLMLLDDVFAELDPGRSRRIIDLFRQGAHGQVLLTAPKESDVDLGPLAGSSPRDVARWRIAHGRIGP